MPVDPIPQVGTDTGRLLFDEFVKASHGKPVDDVIAASINMIANCLRQHFGRRSEVEAKMKELYGRNMEILLEHYDPVTDRRRSIIPFTQTISPQLILRDEESVFFGLGRKGNGR